MSNIHFTWTEEMSVGDETLDSQHKKLLAQLNKVIDSLPKGASSSEAANAFHFFEMYVNEHLAYEEQYMDKRGYHDLEEHKKKHDEFREMYSKFKKKLEDGVLSSDELTETEQFLGDWWVNHIGYEDQQYHKTLGASPT